MDFQWVLFGDFGKNILGLFLDNFIFGDLVFGDLEYTDLIQVILAQLLQNIGMRRRSGAIHSESQQQFIMLAEKSLQKTGIFYDERLYKEVERIQQYSNPKSEKKERTNPFAQFDFDEVKQYEQDQRDLNREIEKQSQVNVKYAIICDQVLPVVQRLDPEGADRTQVREIDLVVRRVVRADGQCVPLKYWVISYSMVDSPMAKVYMSSAARIYWLCSSQCKIDNCLQLHMKDFLPAVQAEQQKYVSS